MLDGVRPFQQRSTLASAPRRERILWSAAGALLAALLAWMAFLLHLNLSSAGSLELLLVIIVALRFGFAEATAVSLVAVVGLNLLFIPPLFRLTVADSANWVSLATFEAAALFISRLSTSVRLHAVEAETQRRRATRLYELSRAILLIDSRAPIEEQLSSLIREIIEVEQVHLTVFPKRVFSSASAEEAGSEDFTQEVTGTLEDATDAAGRMASRTLRIGTSAIGMLKLIGWENDAMLADAVASLAAIAVERVRAVQEETRAEGERDTEKLRTAVLDGLAHGFKTPLTAIQTASSGLLAIGETTGTQTELITIIDEQATLLNQMTTRLLQTASLERRQVRLKRTSESMTALVQAVIASNDARTRRRIRLTAGEDCCHCMVDAELVTLAVNQLIDNAVKYSAIGESVQVSVAEVADGIAVTVENYGVPILPDEADKIFERFYRGSNALAGPAGTGLGLSIVRKAASAHRGNVSIAIEGKRTRFCFTVPR